MKAINCTQCGATIENVSEHSLIIDCEYCGARIMMNRQTPPVVPMDPPRFVAEPEFPASSMSFLKIIGIVVGGFMMIPVLIFAVVMVNRPPKVESEPAKWSSPPDPPVSPIWQRPTLTVPDEKPLPVVNYQPRVSWSGPNDMEYFDSPQVDISSVKHLTSQEIEKTVFKNKIVKLRVVINTEGEINEVETISGHPLLVEAATESAKRSIFSSRSKPTTRVLTYTFRVLKGD